MAEKDLIATISNFVNEIGYDFYTTERLRQENTDLRSQVQTLTEDFNELHQQINKKNENLTKLGEEIEILNKQRVQFLEELGQDLKAQATVVETRYEVNSSGN